MTTSAGALPVAGAAAHRLLRWRHLLFIVLVSALVVLAVVLVLQGAAADPMAGT